MADDAGTSVLTMAAARTSVLTLGAVIELASRRAAAFHLISLEHISDIELIFVLLLNLFTTLPILVDFSNFVSTFTASSCCKMSKTRLYSSAYRRRPKILFSIPLGFLPYVHPFR